MSRCRLFSKENTFWAFFSQVLDADGGCKEVIRKLQSYASIKGIKVPSSSTASYCTARKKLKEQMLSEILEHTARQFNKKSEAGLLNNRRVIVVSWFNGNRTFELFMINHHERRKVHAKKASQLQP